MSEVAAPAKSNSRELFRMVLEAAATNHWATAPLVTVYRFTHPSKFDQAVEQWRVDVSNKVNNHSEAIARLEEALKPTLTVSEEAIALGVWLAKQSQDGLRQLHKVDDICSEFDDMTPQAVREAIAELQELGMLNWNKVIGGYGHIHINYTVFFAFDGVACGYNTIDDAVRLAEMVLNDDSLCGDLSHLESAVGWPRRRFNPAVAMLIPFIGEGRVRNVIQQDYPTMGFLLIDEDCFRLRRFVRENALHGPA